MSVRAGLVGRDDELARLDRFLSDSGRGAMVIRGEAGVGKSALTTALRSRADPAGWRSLQATGVEAERSFALAGLNQMVFGLREELATLDAHAQDVLAPVFGADPAQSPSPIALTVALLDLLAAAARDRPALLIVEDAHWLDELSATVLSAAGRRVAHPRLRIVATIRPRTGADFSAEGWDEIELRPLSAADASRLIDELPVALSTTVRTTILDLAEGNPLALEELPRSAGQLDATTMAMPLTDRLVAVFGSRLRHLESATRTELLRGALDGAGANTGSDSGPRYTMVDVEPAFQLGLLARGPSGDPVFRHPLVRAAVIHQAGVTERRDAHAHLARVYDDILVRKATHLSAATSGPDQSVADLLGEAARQSIRRGGATVAVDWLHRAADLSTDVVRREVLRADAAFVASQASRFDDAQRLVEESPARAESAAGVLTGAYLDLYRDGEVVESHRRIVTALRDVDRLDEATVLRLVKVLLAVSLYAGDQQLWQQTDDLVDRLAGRLDPATLLYRDAWGDLARRGHTVRPRLAAERNRLAALDPWDVMRLGVTAHYIDALAQLRPALTRLFERERDRGAVTNAMTMLHLLLLDQIRSGEWPQAQESVRIGLQLSETHNNPLFRYQFVAYDGLRAACTGDTETARRCASEVTAWAGPRRLGLLLEFAHRIGVLTALGEGDYAGAYSVSSRAAGFPRYSHETIDGLFDVIEAAVHAGQLEAARAHVAEATRLRIGDISPRLKAVSEAARAMTATDAEADELYRSALTVDGIGAFPFEHNRIRLGYGAWLRRQRRTTEAREVLAQAADGFSTLGAQPWETRAGAELRAAGANVKRATGDAGALTAQERTIAELAASGHSNKQIAAQLYLSPRTVGAHLYRIFPKLGVTSRAALGHALRELDGES
ncbi:helix-turn-helix transcriptional regulator [Mycolicibacterium sp. CH28]|uniref:AAA family ATPase n=1 Tax=Mycolicibacterium sp. CH28 TaxID=2512237 RepID=UPI001081BBBA|nr:LuxR family transcriptional regulator [Mycolicibacterium sp. CH28]TGD84557.1 helix-turn-helix transcriptional regulator [Mycolicibacterium sp. CH28]